MPHNLSDVWLIGAGYMAREYAKVLAGLGQDYAAIGRGEAACLRFQEETGHACVPGGVAAQLAQEKPAAAIVAVNAEGLFEITMQLLRAGVPRLLVEKPAALDRADMEALASEARLRGAEVYVAYNRRFYASVLEARRRIAEDGGADAFAFEFTEWSHKIAAAPRSEEALQSWFWANSTHVVDLAFYLGGEPARMDCYTRGTLGWHTPAVFAGGGEACGGALFSYQADWRAPGRWGVEVMTGKHRYILRPLEKLQMQDIGSVAVYDAPAVDYALDTAYKPGLYLQTRAFLALEAEGLLPLAAQARHAAYYEAMQKGGAWRAARQDER